MGFGGEFIDSALLLIDASFLLQNTENRLDYVQLQEIFNDRLSIARKATQGPAADHQEDRAKGHSRQAPTLQSNQSIRGAIFLLRPHRSTALDGPIARV